ncbi:MAG: hypothetical protein V1834_01355, partial [Candidatus Micrarchaeota archaeon]
MAISPREAQAKARKAGWREAARVGKWFMLIGVPLTALFNMANYKPTVAIHDVPTPPARSAKMWSEEKIARMNREAPL